jgi:hypothetical protein
MEVLVRYGTDEQKQRGWSRSSPGRSVPVLP